MSNVRRFLRTSRRVDVLRKRPELLGFVDRVTVFLERDVLRRTRKTEIRQPPAVRERPPVPSGVSWDTKGGAGLLSQRRYDDRVREISHLSAAYRS